MKWDETQYIWSKSAFITNERLRTLFCKNGGGGGGGGGESYSSFSYIEMPHGKREDC